MLGEVGYGCYPKGFMMDLLEHSHTNEPIDYADVKRRVPNQARSPTSIQTVPKELAEVITKREAEVYFVAVCSI